MSSDSPVATIRELYLRLAAARFDKAVIDGELPEPMLLALASALADNSLVDAAGDALELRLPGRPIKKWNLAGLNHEYIVHLAVIAKLRNLLGGEDERLHVEFKTADAVVMRRGRQDAALLQVEVKTTGKGSAREQAEATREGDTPIRRRIRVLNPARVLFVWANIDEAVWRAVEDGRVVGEPVPVDWNEIRDFLSRG